MRARVAVTVASGVVLATLAVAGAASAQSTAQIPLQFDFMNPGARSLGMGGAFIGAADDASAAYANPSGLTQITTREFSAEVRFRGVDTSFLEGGRVSGTVTGIGTDVIAGPRYAIDTDRHTTLAFVSFVMPVGRVTVAGYRHQAVRIENSFFSTGPFERATFGGITDDNNREVPLGGSRSLAIANYGGAVAYRIRDGLSVGGGLSVYTFHLDSHFARFSVQSDVFSPVDLNTVTATAVQSGDETSWGANAGMLWRASPALSIGAQFRRGPRFDFSQEDQVPLNDFDLVRQGRFKVPDVFGAGLQWHASQALRVLADYDWVHYGQLKEDFINIQSLSTGRQAQLFIDNGQELHGGLEYVWINLAKPVALRGGVWLDPDHAVRYESTPAHDSVDVLLAATLPGGKTLVHYTTGVGVALSNRSELNAGIDVSSQTIYLTASGVIRF